MNNNEIFCLKNVLFSPCIILNDIMYSFTRIGSIPIKVNVNSGEVFYGDEPLNYDMLNGEADMLLSMDDNIFALESCGKRMMNYDLKKNICQYIDIECNASEWGNFAAFVGFKKGIYIFPRKNNYILKVDIENGKVTKECMIYEEIEKRAGIKPDFSCGCQVEDNMWLFDRYGFMSIEYNFEKKDFRIHELPDCIKNCVHIQYRNKRFYILGTNGSVYIWDAVNHKCETLINNVHRQDEIAYMRLVVTDSNVWILPALDNNILVVDLQSGKNEIYKAYPSDFEYIGDKEVSKYYGQCEYQGCMYMAMRSANYLLKIDLKSGKETWIKPIIPTLSEVFEHGYSRRLKIINEQSGTMEAFFECVNNIVVTEKTQCSSNTGNDIWRKIK